MMGPPTKSVRWFPRIATDADLGRPDRRLASVPPAERCSDCKEWCEYIDTEDGDLISNCCGASAYAVDEDAGKD